MKFGLINTACDAVFKFETAENRSTVYKALDDLAHKDIQSYMTILSEFAESERTQEDYNTMRVAIMGAPLPPKPTPAEIISGCLNGKYGRGVQLAAKRIKDNGPSKKLMLESIVTLLKPYNIILTEEELLAAIEQL